jgi:hypothetical protein
MRKKQVPELERPVRDGVPMRVRFASHKQIELITNAARRRGLSRDRFIQRVLQVAAEHVMNEPLTDAAASNAAAQL